VCIHLRLVTRLLSKTQKVSLLRADISYKVALGVDVLQMQVFQIEAARNNLHRSEVMTSSNLVAVVRLGSTVLKKKVAGSTDKALELGQHCVLGNFGERNPNEEVIGLRAILSTVKIPCR